MRGWRSTRSSGRAKARRRWSSGARSCRSSSRTKRRPIDRAFVYSIFERDHPDCAERRVVDAFADAILALDDSMPNGTYIDMCSKLPVVDPARIAVPTIVMRGQYDGIAALRRPDRVLRALPNPDKQFTMMAGISHASFQQKNYLMVVPDPARLVHAAGSGLPLTGAGGMLATPEFSGYDRRVPGGNPRRRQITNRTGEDLTSWRRSAQAAKVCIESST